MLHQSNLHATVLIKIEVGTTLKAKRTLTLDDSRVFLVEFPIRLGRLPNSISQFQNYFKQRI